MILRAFLPSVTKRHVERRILATNPQHLFRIVQDVDRYSEFLPFCLHSKVLWRGNELKEDEDAADKENVHPYQTFRATLTVGMPFVQETYVSHVKVWPQTMTIETKSVESKLFDSLQSRWQLKPVPESTSDDSVQVDFEVEMTVSDPLVSTMLEEVLSMVAGQQVEAFAKRCAQLPIQPELQKP